MALHLFILVLFLIPFNLFANETLTFEQIESMYNVSEIGENTLLKQQVQIRGFLYKDADGKYILASKPNLKSCCLGNEKNRYQQILVDLNDDSNDLQGYAVLVAGIFRYRDDGRLHLNNAYIVSENKSYITFWAIVVVILVALIAWGLRRQRISG